MSQSISDCNNIWMQNDDLKFTSMNYFQVFF